MDYQELINRMLKGRSVNAAALASGIPQKSLDRYVKGATVPGCKAAKLMAREAGVPLEEAIDAIVKKEDEMVRPRRAQRLLPGFTTTAAAVLIAVTNFLTPGNAEAASRLASEPIAQTYALSYVK
jgi:hypothetical protein